MKIRVLEVLATLKRAGAERTAVTLANGLDGAMFETGVVSLYDAFPGGFEAELADRIPIRHLGKRPGLDPRMWPRLSRTIRGFQPSIVHTHSYVLRYAWPVSHAPVVHTIHNLADREADWLGRVLHRFAMRHGVRSIAISREVARSFRSVYQREPDAVIPNGVNLTSESRGWRAENGFAPHDILIVSVARLDPQKNPLLLIDALPADPRCHLLLVGDGCLRRAVQQREGPRVHVLGVRTDVARILADCDVFALASDYEGLPIAVMEAMAAGLPVIATAAGGVPELVEHEIHGLLVPVRDAPALRRALETLIAEPELRRALGEQSRARACLFRADRMVEAYAAFFERLIGEQK